MRYILCAVSISALAILFATVTVSSIDLKTNLNYILEAKTFIFTIRLMIMKKKGKIC